MQGEKPSITSPNCIHDNTTIISRTVDGYTGYCCTNQGYKMVPMPCESGSGWCNPNFICEKVNASA
jgi:hypothetical protein